MCKVLLCWTSTSMTFSFSKRVTTGILSTVLHFVQQCLIFSVYSLEVWPKSAFQIYAPFMGFLRHKVNSYTKGNAILKHYPTLQSEWIFVPVNYYVDSGALQDFSQVLVFIRSQDMTAVSQLWCWLTCWPYHCNFKQITQESSWDCLHFKRKMTSATVCGVLAFLASHSTFLSLAYSTILCSLLVIYNSCLVSRAGGRVKTWKRRWFILTDNCLYYFEYTTVSNCRHQRSLAGLGKRFIISL